MGETGNFLDGILLICIGMAVWVFIVLVQYNKGMLNDVAKDSSMKFFLTLYTIMTVIAFLTYANVIPTLEGWYYVSCVYAGFMGWFALGALFSPRSTLKNNGILIEDMSDDAAETWIVAARYFMATGQLTWACIFVYWAMTLSLNLAVLPYAMVPLAAAFSLTGLMWAYAMVRGLFDIIKPKATFWGNVLLATAFGVVQFLYVF